jgi:hypothetical protein
MNWRKILKLILWSVAGMGFAGSLAIGAMFWPFIVPLAFLQVHNASAHPVIVNSLDYAKKTVARNVVLEGGRFSETYCIVALPWTEIRLNVNRPGGAETAQHHFAVRQGWFEYCHRRLIVGQESVEISGCKFFEGIWPPDCLSPF